VQHWWESQTEHEKFVSRPQCLLTTASASITEFMVNNWWDQAVQVFNYANENWDGFAAAADSVGDEQWEPLWNFCNEDGDDLISAGELTKCAAAVAGYVGMSDASQGFLYNFGVLYWDTVDYDGDGALNYDEYKYTMAGFAATDAGVILAAFDHNDDGILGAFELEEWMEFMNNYFLENNWDESSLDALEQLWIAAQVDYDTEWASRVELSRFIIGLWNVLLTSTTVEYSEVISEVISEVSCEEPCDEIHDFSEGFEGGDDYIGDNGFYTVDE